MDDLFQRPLGPISIILNFPKKFLVKADIKHLSPKTVSGPIVLHTHHQVKALGCPYKTFTTATDLMCRVQPEPE